ncbi:hypothetical protein EVAR_47916_1 [Eumeta japonica]|uniref:Uncharacterized protein n=1 Tax=Eumeta variegata TaxID=151549 RepID=A0A4C1Y5B1_EUMVA|nr:hypothetical protein EVAR_47916_1 [Eumeta japonica]
MPSRLGRCSSGSLKSVMVNMTTTSPTYGLKRALTELVSHGAAFLRDKRASEPPEVRQSPPSTDTRNLEESPNFSDFHGLSHPWSSLAMSVSRISLLGKGMSKSRQWLVPCQPWRSIKALRALSDSDSADSDKKNWKEHKIFIKLNQRRSLEYE